MTNTEATSTDYVDYLNVCRAMGMEWTRALEKTRALIGEDKDMCYTVWREYVNAQSDHMRMILDNTPYVNNALLDF